MPSTKESQKTSKASAKQSQDSKTVYRKPRNAKEFAAQANDIATRILNGEIELETARVYASVARVVAQALSTSVTQARFLKEVPDLSLLLGDEADG